MVSFSLKDKVALITGASRGIGEAIAMTLADRGAHCILASRKIEALEEVVGKIKEQGGSAEAMACNMGYMEQITEMMKAIGDKHGKLDILVNNAAANPYFGEMINAEDWAWEKTMGVNLKAPFFLTQAAAKMMKEKGGGSIVNVSSINGVRPAALQGIYSITKAALINMTQGFAKELAPFKIRVNALLPGLTDTKFAGALTANEDVKNMVVAQIPLHRMAQPEEMAGAVLYLASEASSFTTGACIVCDGGMIA
jgi:NAD(P)-dependent dehydrogenase (short-subunit alcohol dehydrogenase family)